MARIKIRRLEEPDLIKIDAATLPDWRPDGYVAIRNGAIIGSLLTPKSLTQPGLAQAFFDVYSLGVREPWLIRLIAQCLNDDKEIDTIYSYCGEGIPRARPMLEFFGFSETEETFYDLHGEPMGNMWIWIREAAPKYFEKLKPAELPVFID